MHVEKNYVKFIVMEQGNFQRRTVEWNLVDFGINLFVNVTGVFPP